MIFQPIKKKKTNSNSMFSLLPVQYWVIWGIRIKSTIDPRNLNQLLHLSDVGPKSSCLIARSIMQKITRPDSHANVSGLWHCICLIVYKSDAGCQRSLSNDAPSSLTNMCWHIVNPHSKLQCRLYLVLRFGTEENPFKSHDNIFHGEKVSLQNGFSPRLIFGKNGRGQRATHGGSNWPKICTPGISISTGYPQDVDAPCTPWIKRVVTPWSRHCKIESRSVTDRL